MKDYSLNEEERKNFILNYTKEEETITVNFADGSNYTIPNTENNEDKLEGKMIEQVANSKERKHKAIRINWYSNCHNIFIYRCIFKWSILAW